MTVIISCSPIVNVLNSVCVSYLPKSVCEKVFDHVRSNSERKFETLWSLSRKVLEQVSFHVELWLTWGFTSLLWHWACQWCIFFSDCSASWTPSAAELMEKKTSEHERKDAKACGCARVINGDESAFGVKMHVDVLHTVPTPFSPCTHTIPHACTNKNTMLLWHHW